MSNELPQNHLETMQQFIEGTAEGTIERFIEAAIEEADRFLTSLEEQIKLGFLTASAETEMTSADE